MVTDSNVMSEWLAALHRLATTGMPHYWCVQRNLIILGLEIPADAAIWLAYCSIPLSLLILGRHLRPALIALGGPRMMRFLYEFVAFILLCGATHFMSLLTVAWPWFFAAALVKFVCAIVSVFTAVDLILVLRHLRRAAAHVLALPGIQDVLEQMIADDRAMTARIRAKWLNGNQ